MDRVEDHMYLLGKFNRGITVDQYRNGMKRIYRQSRAFKDYKRSRHKLIKNQHRALKRMFKK